jgi:hypothetical protein
MSFRGPSYYVTLTRLFNQGKKVISDLNFIGSALQGRNMIVMHPETRGVCHHNVALPFT